MPEIKASERLLRLREIREAIDGIEASDGADDVTPSKKIDMLVTALQDFVWLFIQEEQVLVEERANGRSSYRDSPAP
jgi:methylthioribose-1-phosphate isomerase